jgi:hypothetical protein
MTANNKLTHKYMKKFTSLITLALLLCSLLASKTQASIMPQVHWDRYLTYENGAWTENGALYNNWNGVTLNLTVGNVAIPDNVKHIYIEMEYNGPAPVPPAVSSIPGTTVAGPDVYDASTSTSRTWHWTITPQPDIEYIQFYSANWNYVSKVDVGIFCTGIPEPSTYFAGLSALGLLGMFGWRNRK